MDLPSINLYKLANTPGLQDNLDSISNDYKVTARREASKEFK